MKIIHAFCLALGIVGLVACDGAKTPRLPHPRLPRQHPLQRRPHLLQPRSGLLRDSFRTAEDSFRANRANKGERENRARDQKVEQRQSAADSGPRNFGADWALLKGCFTPP
jgi:hypothetical protein